MMPDRPEPETELLHVDKSRSPAPCGCTACWPPSPRRSTGPSSMPRPSPSGCLRTASPAKSTTWSRRSAARFRMSFKNFTTDKSHSFGGEYLELVPHELIRYTDRFDDPNLPGDMSVTVKLKAVSVGTEINIEQSGIPAADPNGSLLSRLAGIARAACAARRRPTSRNSPHGPPSFRPGREIRAVAAVQVVHPRCALRRAFRHATRIGGLSVKHFDG